MAWLRPHWSGCYSKCQTTRPATTLHSWPIFKNNLGSLAVNSDLAGLVVAVCIIDAEQMEPSRVLCYPLKVRHAKFTPDDLLHSTMLMTLRAGEKGNSHLFFCYPLKVRHGKSTPDDLLQFNTALELMTLMAGEKVNSHFVFCYPLKVRHANSTLNDLSHLALLQGKSHAGQVRKFTVTLGYAVCFSWHVYFLDQCSLGVDNHVGNPTGMSYLYNGQSQLTIVAW